jgi:hypothetical protein
VAVAAMDSPEACVGVIITHRGLLSMIGGEMASPEDELLDSLILLIIKGLSGYTFVIMKYLAFKFCGWRSSNFVL